MKLKVKITLCALLALFAVLCLGAVLSGLGVIPAAATEQTYLLREWNGYIGIFCPADAPRPSTVTDIRVADLPLGDRLELKAGIGVTDYRAAAQLLEDYGA